MDYYSTAENGLIALLISELPVRFPNGASQVTASDDTVYNNGNRYYATTYPGAFPVSDTGTMFVEYDFAILLDLLTRYETNDKDTWDNFKALRSDVINLINHTQAGKTLGKTNYVRDAFISSGDDPRYIPFENSPDSPAFVAQTCTVTAKMLVPKE